MYKLKSLIALAIAQTFAAPEGTAAAEPEKVKFCDKSWNEQGIVSFKFGNGTVLEFDSNKVNAETKHDLLCHGASQKIGDSYAGVKGNYAEGIANAKSVIDQLYAGEWTADREGGAPRLAELAAAIARIKGVDEKKALEAVTAANDEQRKGWRGNAKVKATIAAIRAEKAAKALEAAGAEAQAEISIDIK